MNGSSDIGVRVDNWKTVLGSTTGVELEIIVRGIFFKTNKQTKDIWSVKKEEKWDLINFSVKI